MNSEIEVSEPDEGPRLERHLVGFPTELLRSAKGVAGVVVRIALYGNQTRSACEFHLQLPLASVSAFGHGREQLEATSQVANGLLVGRALGRSHACSAVLGCRLLCETGALIVVRKQLRLGPCTVREVLFECLCNERVVFTLPLLEKRLVRRIL